MEIQFKCYHFNDKFMNTNWPNHVSVMINNQNVPIPVVCCNNFTPMPYKVISMSFSKRSSYSKRLLSCLFSWSVSYDSVESSILSSNHLFQTSNMQNQPTHMPMFIKRYCNPGRNVIAINVRACCCSHLFTLQFVSRPSVRSILESKSSC